MNEEVILRLGVLVDTAESFLALQEMNLPVNMRIDSLKTAVTDLRDGIKSLYFEVGGKDVWDAPRGGDG